MADHDPGRRQFLGLLLAAPMVAALDYQSALARLEAPAPGREAALKQLVLQLGPWTPAEEAEAVDFAARFLAAEQIAGPYLAQSPETLQGLAGRFASEVAPLHDIDLSALSEEERELLLGLVQQLYSFVEIRDFIGDEPPIGVCGVGPEKRHTVAPR